MNKTIIAILALAALIAFAGCANHPGGSNEPDRQAAPAATTDANRNQPPVQTAVVRYEAVPLIVTGYGAVQGGPNSKAALAFPEAGRIAQVDVNVGDRVSAGQTLAQLDSVGFRAATAEASAQVASAHANYDKAVALTQGSSTQLVVAQAQLRRQEQLLKLGIASQSEVDAAKATVAAAQAQLGVRGAGAQAQPPDVEAARAAIQQAQAALAAAEQNVAYTTLTAPFSGVVTARLHNDGESVDPSTPVIEIAKDTNVVFTAQFAPADAERIQVGDRAAVVAQSGGKRSEGNVVAINPNQSDPSRQVDILIRLSSGGIAFGPGAYGTASVRVGSHGGLVVPKGAVVSDPTTGSNQVFKKIGDRFVPLPVTVKQTFGGRTWVEADELHAGDRVATRGAFELNTSSQQGPADPDAQ